MFFNWADDIFQEGEKVPFSTFHLRLFLELQKFRPWLHMSEDLASSVASIAASRVAPSPTHFLLDDEWVLHFNIKGKSITSFHRSLDMSFGCSVSHIKIKTFKKCWIGIRDRDQPFLDEDKMGDLRFWCSALNSVVNCFLGPRLLFFSSFPHITLTNPVASYPLLRPVFPSICCSKGSILKLRN